MTDIEKQNRGRIADYIRSGSAPDGNYMIGLELEHIIVHRTTQEPVTYAEPNGIRDVLEALAPFYDRRIYAGEDLIGLVGDDANITLEPGAQLEISIAPFEKIGQIADVYRLFKDRLDTVLERYDHEALTLGYLPRKKSS
ncbi:MAG: hypothetical protein HGA54_09100, partial [Actinobacteria bacterium]|nr:hypothetical protein [Actinomycetota bacterium]